MLVAVPVCGAGNDVQVLGDKHLTKHKHFDFLIFILFLLAEELKTVEFFCVFKEKLWREMYPKLKYDPSKFWSE